MDEQYDQGYDENYGDEYGYGQEDYYDYDSYANGLQLGRSMSQDKGYSILDIDELVIQIEKEN